MKTEILSIEHPQAIPRALELLQVGKLVAFPTDTVYGLAALITDREAIDLIFQAKQRSPSKAIAVLIGELSQLDQVTPGLSETALRLASRYWPGALTLVVNSLPGLPDNLSPTPTIGVRMPDLAFTRRLLAESGPLATTSANLSGGPNPRSAGEVLDQLEGRVELVLDGGEAPGGVPSTVVDCTALAGVAILREGAIPSADIMSLASAK
jgi:L-threonylcarbamoyladenylate synthase